MLLQGKFVSKERLLKEYETISKTSAPSNVLKYLGISTETGTKNKPHSKDSTPKDDLRSNDSPKQSPLSSNLKLKENKDESTAPSNEKQKADNSSNEQKPTLVLSSRIKQEGSQPIEELSVPEKVDKKVQERNKEDIANANYIYNDLLSPYSEQLLSASKQRNSPVKPTQNGSVKNKNRDVSCKRTQLKSSEKEVHNSNINKTTNDDKSTNINSVEFKRDISEYFLTNKSNGDIDFPKLLRDEIAHVDQILVQESKKAMQIGGMPNFRFF